MRYDSPELRERLAGEYVLGTMPGRARTRFERLMRDNATVAAEVAAWEARFAPLDAIAEPVAPPARVWSAVERRIGPDVRSPAPARGWFGSFAFWRGLAAGAAAACAGLALYLALAPTPPGPTVVAVLAGDGGQPSWVALTQPGHGEVSVAAIRDLAADTAHSFQLWGISGGPPRPLGILPPEASRRLLVAASSVPPLGGVLAVSLEPPGGSPTGQPTGPVLYQGKVLTTP